MAKLTIEELKRKREEERKRIYIRDGEFKRKIIVHMGTCGIAAGARDIVSAFMDEIEKSGVKDIMLTTSGCAGLCSREPMATVEVIKVSGAEAMNLKSLEKPLLVSEFRKMRKNEV